MKVLVSAETGNLGISDRDSVLICGALVAAVFVFKSGFFKYKTYEDCMLGELRGQDVTMRMVAGKKCAQMFHTPSGLPETRFTLSCS